MAKQIKRIGVLTSGGDAPGMNAVVRAVVRTTAAYGISCLGIRRGYRGLINGDIVELGARSVDGIISKGGTMLYTARCLEMLTEEGLQQAADNAQYMGLDGLIVCGGDGSFRGAQALSRKGIPAIGVPGPLITILYARIIPLALILPAIQPFRRWISCAIPCSLMNAVLL